MPTRKLSGFTIVELTVSLAIMSLLALNTMPALAKYREAARRTKCKDNLMQYGLSFFNYHDVHNRLPPGYVVRNWDAPSQQGFGWGFSLLPYLDQAQLYTVLQYEGGLEYEGGGLDESTKNPAKKKAMRTSFALTRCPSDNLPAENPFRGGWPTSNYSGNAGALPFPRLASGSISDFWPGQVAANHPTGSRRDDRSLTAPHPCNGIFAANSSVSFDQITDGTSSTLLMSERGKSSMGGIWLGVTAATHENDAITEVSHLSRPNKSLKSFSSQHHGGIHIALCDGSVRWMNDNIDSSAGAIPKEYGVLQKLGDRSDGRVLDDF
jgi:type II secretory pathway pseudopilin PulG